MDSKAVADRGILESLYDRPSFHCGHLYCTFMGRIGAVMEQHQDNAHPDLVAAQATFGWYDWACTLCGFDARAEVQRLYPEGS